MALGYDVLKADLALCAAKFFDEEGERGEEEEVDGEEREIDDRDCDDRPGKHRGPRFNV